MPGSGYGFARPTLTTWCHCTWCPAAHLPIDKQPRHATPRAYASQLSYSGYVYGRAAACTGAAAICCNLPHPSTPRPTRLARLPHRLCTSLQVGSPCNCPNSLMPPPHATHDITTPRLLRVPPAPPPPPPSIPPSPPPAPSPPDTAAAAAPAAPAASVPRSSSTLHSGGSARSAAAAAPTSPLSGWRPASCTPPTPPPPAPPPWPARCPSCLAGTPACGPAPRAAPSR